MSRTFSSRAPGMNFDVIYPETVPEIFCDGIADVMFQGTHVRLSMYQNRPLDIQRMAREPMQDDPAEIRQVAAFITMPTAQFVEGFANVLRALADNAPTGELPMAIQNAQLKASLAAIRASDLGTRPPIPGPVEVKAAEGAAAPRKQSRKRSNRTKTNA